MAELIVCEEISFVVPFRNEKDEGVWKGFGTTAEKATNEKTLKRRQRNFFSRLVAQKEKFSTCKRPENIIKIFFKCFGVFLRLFQS